MNIYCVKVGPKYDHRFVNNLNKMLSQHWQGDFELTCITDDPTGVECRTIAHPNKDLFGWWTKMVLFDQGFIEGPGVFFDLDIAIQGSVEWVNQPKQQMTFLSTPWVDLVQLRKDVRNQYQRFCSINSSALVWDESTDRQSIFEDYIKQREKIEFCFTGIDSYVQHRHPYEVFENQDANSFYNGKNVGNESLILFDKDAEGNKDLEMILKWK